MEELITQSKLKELLNYDPSTGIFIWRKNRGRGIKAGDLAGYIGNGYRIIRVDSRQYPAQRLAFLYMEGYFPEHEVDHIDRDKSNNCWNNLREVTKTCNIRNRNVLKRNSSTVTGVNFVINSGKWTARIGSKSKAIFLGNFMEFKNAVKARWNAEIKYKYPACNTTSSAYIYLKKHNLLGG